VYRGGVRDASGAAKENARSPSTLRHLDSLYSVLQSPGGVDGESLNQFGKVYRTVTHVDGVHHAAQLEQKAAGCEPEANGAVSGRK